MIEKIEIVRGGGSVLYGSEATGGVVNIITKNTVKTVLKFLQAIMAVSVMQYLLVPIDLMQPHLWKIAVRYLT